MVPAKLVPAAISMLADSSAQPHDFCDQRRTV
jgi:hypothetical protein